MNKHAVYEEAILGLPKYLRNYKYRTDYDDILQEARVRIWETLTDKVLSHPNSNLPAYVQRVARNAANLWIQRSSKSPYVPYAERLKEQQLNSGTGDFTYEEEWRITNYKNIHSLDSLDRKIKPSDQEDGDTRLIDLIPSIPLITSDDSLEEAISKLSAIHQLILVLHDLSGMTMAEVSKIDGKERCVESLYIQRLEAMAQLEKLLIESYEAK